MKLKTLVGSLAVLGLVTTAAHALPRKPQSTNTQASNTTQRVQNLESIINRNQDDASDNPQSLLNSEWYKSVVVSGEFQVVGGYGNRTINYSGDRNTSSGTSEGFITKRDHTNIYMNTMELYLDAAVNNYTKLHAALSYDYDPSSFSTGATNTNVPGQTMYFSEADIQFANLAQTGLYGVVGKQFFNFGSYTHDSMMTPMTEMLSKTVGTGATVGYVSNMGFNVDAYTFSGPLEKRGNAVRALTATDVVTSDRRIDTWGASAGYTMKNQMFGFNAQLGYLDNMAQTIYISQSINSRAATTIEKATYAKSTSGLSAHADLSSGPFDLILDYVSALHHFDSNDLQTNYSTAGSKVEAAKPQALLAQLGYNFNVMRHASTAYVAFENSKDTVQMYGAALGGFYMPKTRTTVGYKYNLMTNVDLNALLYHDKDHKYDATQTNTGTGRTSDGVDLGVTVKF